MPIDRRVADLLLLAALLLAGWSAVNVWNALEQGRLPEQNTGSEKTSLTAFAIVDSALAPEPSPIFFSFSGSFQSPFGKASPAPAKRRVSSAPREAVDLTLKGILTKTPPLAIIQDGSGRTHICKPGDAVGDYTVTAIDEEQARVRKGGRSYILQGPGQ